MGSIFDWFRTIYRAAENNQGMTLAIFILAFYLMMYLIGRWIEKDGS